MATSRSVNGAERSRASRTAPRASGDLDARARAAGRWSAARRTTARRRRRCPASTSTASRDVGRGDQRPGEQRVRAERHQQQRVDLRPDHRPAGAEGVGGRAGRRGERRRRRSPIATAAGRRPRRRPRASARARPSRRSPRSTPSLGLRPAPSSTHGDVERQPLLDGVRARRRSRRPSARDRARSASARKPTWPRLMPSTGVPAQPGDLGRAQDGAVAAERHGDLAAGRRVVRSARRRRSRAPRLSASRRASGPACRTSVSRFGDLARHVDGRRVARCG